MGVRRNHLLQIATQLHSLIGAGAHLPLMTQLVDSLLHDQKPVLNFFTDIPKNSALAKEIQQNPAAISLLQNIIILVSDPASEQKSIFKSWQDYLTNKAPYSAQQTSVNHKLNADNIDALGKDIISIFDRFYLNQIEVVSSNNFFSSTNKLLSSIAKVFSPDKKIIKPANNKKVLLANNIIENINKIITDSVLSAADKLAKITAIIQPLHEKYHSNPGNFGKAIRYAYEKINQLKEAAPSKILAESSEEFMTIAEKFTSDVKSQQKKSMRFEPSRILKSSSAKEFMVNLVAEAVQQPPEFGGKEEFIEVLGIEELNNSELFAKYEHAKHQVIHSASISNHTNIGINLASLNTKLDSASNEVFLYHGTSLSASRLIGKTGFNSEKFCARGSINGYGPLGRGTYFTNELAKAGTFAMCAQCGKHRCACQSADGAPIPKIALVCKVVLGNAEMITHKSQALSNSSLDPQSGFHSRIGISKQQDAASQFNSTEICIANDNQIYPQYIISYHHAKNLLNPNILMQEIPHCNHELKNLVNTYAQLQAAPQTAATFHQQIDTLLTIKFLTAELSQTQASNPAALAQYQEMNRQTNFTISRLTNQLNQIKTVDSSPQSTAMIANRLQLDLQKAILPDNANTPQIQTNNIEPASSLAQPIIEASSEQDQSSAYKLLR